MYMWLTSMWRLITINRGYSYRWCRYMYGFTLALYKTQAIIHAPVCIVLLSICNHVLCNIIYKEICLCLHVCIYVYIFMHSMYYQSAVFSSISKVYLAILQMSFHTLYIIALFCSFKDEVESFLPHALSLPSILIF